MKMFFKQDHICSEIIGEEYTSLNLKDSLQKTRLALDIAYAGFDDALDADLIDSYIYEIIALQKRYHYLTMLADTKTVPESDVSCQNSPIRTLVSHVFG